MTKQPIRMYTTTWCGDCYRAKHFFTEKGIDYREINIERDMEARQYVRNVSNGMESVPVILFPDESVLIEPTTRELAKKVEELSL